MKVNAKKLFAVVLAFILISITGVVNADVTTGGLSIAAVGEQHPSDTFQVSVNFSNLNTDVGRNLVINGNIDYDKDKLEFVSIVSNTGAGWDEASEEADSFSKTTMNYVLENKTGVEGLDANSNLFTLTFKVKEGATGTANVRVTVDDISFGQNFSGASTTVTIVEPTKEPEQNPDEKEPELTPGDKDQGGSQGSGEQKDDDKGTGSETGKTDEENKGDNTTSPNTLPQTGVTYALWGGVAACVIAALAVVVLYQKAKYKATRAK